MPDIQSLLLALGAMPQKEREEFLGAALSQQPGASLEAILLKLGLEELAVNTKVRLVFKMGISPVAHSFRAGPERHLNWVVPVVPDHLRILVYSTSRLINEFQETLTCLQNGRGDFVKAFTLLNPENMMGMVNRFSDEMQTYTQQLRDANGRLNRFGPRGKRSPTAKPSTTENNLQDSQAEQAASKKVESEAAAPETEREQKSRKTSARTRKTQPGPEVATGGETSEADAVAGEKDREIVETSVAAASGDYATDGNASGMVDSDGMPAADGVTSPLTVDELAVFGFDVNAVAGNDSGADHPGNSGK